MTLGIFGNTRRPLGIVAPSAPATAAGSSIPAQCWDVPGFKDCHGRAYAAAAARADANNLTGTRRTEYITTMTDVDALKNCGCTPGGSASSGGSQALPWKAYDARTVSLQNAVNQVLKAKGYPAMTVDGKLGPGTCGAAKLSDREYGTAFSQQYGLAASCQSYTEPRKSSGASFSPLPTTEEPTPMVQTSSMFAGLDLKMMLLVGAVAVGAVFLLSDDKKKKGQAA